jgi:hypothetical protein
MGSKKTKLVKDAPVNITLTEKATKRVMRLACTARSLRSVISDIQAEWKPIPFPVSHIITELAAIDQIDVADRIDAVGLIVELVGAMAKFWPGDRSKTLRKELRQLTLRAYTESPDDDH